MQDKCVSKENREVCIWANEEREWGVEKAS